MRSRKGFTLIEILVIVAIIAILATAIMTFLGESKRKARINSAKTSLQSALPAVILCNDSNGEINRPSGSETGNTEICKWNITPGSKWPKLPIGYDYISSENYSANCYFKVSVTSGDRSDLICDCIKQSCN